MIKVEIWSDLNCPFCYIGKRRLEMALAYFNERDKVLIEWKSFELDPFASPSPREDYTELLARKYRRNREWAEQLNKEMTSLANTAGLDFHMDKIIPANSFNAHRLLHLAKTKNLKTQNELKEILFSYKFIEGKNINSRECLREAGLSVGLDPDAIIAVLESDKFEEDVRNDEGLAEAMGISAVPHFRFNKIHIISGARPPEVFLKMLEECSRFDVNKPIEF